MKKVLSLVIACLMLFSVMTVTSFAASTAHTITLSVDGETTLKAGDTFTLTASLDKSEAICGVTFYVALPKAAFEIEVEDIPNEIYHEDIYNDYELMFPPYTNYDWADAHLSLGGTKRWGDPLVGTYDIGDYYLVTYQAAKSAGISTKNSIENMEVLGIDVKVADTVAAGEYAIAIYDDRAAYCSETMDGGESLGTQILSTPLTITVEGEPSKITAEKIGLKTDDSQILRLADIKVNNDNGESYTVNTALGFVSCVNADANATDLYTEINLEGWTGEALKIPAKNTTTVGDQIYFVAAVTSIREANLNKAFSAKAYATVGGQPVEDSNTVSATYNVQ